MIEFELIFTHEANQKLVDLQRDPKKLRRVRKCLGLLQRDPKHSGLNSHKLSAIRGPSGEAVWVSYVENNTPAAWRVFWHFGPKKGQVTVLTITPHP